MTQQEVEAALDAGLLWARVSNGNLWRVRRNGKTQTWKTRPGEFRIPIKAGFRAYGELTQDALIKFEHEDKDANFIIRGKK